MAHILSKLHTAVDRTIPYFKGIKIGKEYEDELIFFTILKKASSILAKIEFIIDKDKDIFGYSKIVISLFKEEWNYFNELYCLLVRIYLDSSFKMRCDKHIRSFNELANNTKQKEEMDLISLLENILANLELEEHMNILNFLEK